MFYFLKMFKTIFIKQETLAPPPLKEGGLALVLIIEKKVIKMFLPLLRFAFNNLTIKLATSA